ncbi:MAG: type II toxin-antitoxin system VapC family toxin [Bacteroidetes bacterium]|nr:type II toxin-antitoxin system VapC family toxin [Bacteroidota bacterium]
MENRKMVVDTGIFIEYLRAKNKTGTTLYNFPDNTEIYISVVTLFELYIGATTTEKWNDVKKLSDGIEIVPLSSEIAEEAAFIFLELKKDNSIIEFRDIFIAATARKLQIPVKTFNKDHFGRIRNLKVL